MKVSTIIDVLKAHSHALAAPKCADRGSELLRLADAFEKARDKTTTALAKTLRGIDCKSIASRGEIEGVLRQIESLRAVLLAAGAKPAAKGFAELLEALLDNSALTFDSIEAAMTASPTAKTSREAKGNRTSFDPAEARRIADQLTAASRDSQAFSRLLDSIKSMKLSKHEVAEIANHFLGHPSGWTYKSVAEAVRKIEERHALDALSASRARTIERINV